MVVNETSTLLEIAWRTCREEETVGEVTDFVLCLATGLRVFDSVQLAGLRVFHCPTTI